MKKKLVNEIYRIKEMMGILNEQIDTTHDKTYDYKKEGDTYYFRKKDSGESGWKKATGTGLEAIRTKVFGEKPKKSTTQPTTKKTSTTQPTTVKYDEEDFFNPENYLKTTMPGSTTRVERKPLINIIKEPPKLPFKDKTEGNKFRNWVNDNYPAYAKEIDLDRSGSYNNEYIKKAWGRYGNEYIEDKSTTNTKNSDEESNPNLVVSGDIADKFTTIDFNDLSTKDSTHNVCIAGSNNCAQFVNDLRDDLTYVGNAWNAYTNSRLGNTIYSAFKGLDNNTKQEVIDLWLKIHKKGGGVKNGPYSGEVKRIVSKLVPQAGEVKDLQINDTVGLFYPGSSHHEEAFYEGGDRWFTEDGEGNKLPGNTINSGDGWGMNTHIGTVAAIKDGVPLIFHNVYGDVISDPPSKLRIAWVKRPGGLTSIINKTESFGKSIYDYIVK